MDEKKTAETIDRKIFHNAYAEKAPWDIGKPQPVFRALADTVVGSVLDAGCGTGEHALFFASRGHEATGFDFLEEAIAAANRKAVERGLAATFLVQDALKLQEWTVRFDSVIDSGLFHVFSDRDRSRYVSGLKTVLNRGGQLFLLCFSDEQPGTDGPRRVSKTDLRDAFSEGWEIKSIEPARLEFAPNQDKHVSRAKTRGHGFWSQNALPEAVSFLRCAVRPSLLISYSLLTLSQGSGG